MRSTTADFGIARPVDPPARVAEAPAEEPVTDVQRGVTCIGAGAIGVVTSIGGLTMATSGIAQAGALSLLVLSLLVCEFAYNALWSPPEERR